MNKSTKRDIHTGRNKKEFQEYYKGIQSTSSEPTTKQDISDYAPDLRPTVGNIETRVNQDAYKNNFQKDSFDVKFKVWAMENLKIIICSGFFLVIIAWLVTQVLSYNKEVGKYQEKADNFEKQIDMVDSDISNLSNEIHSIDKECGIIETKQQNLDDKITKLENDFNNLKK